MTSLTDLVNRKTMMRFQRVIETKDINLLKKMLENNPQLIHPTYRNLDILTIDYIAQFFIEYGYLLRQLNPIYEVLTKNIPHGLKDKEEIELLLHLIDLNVIVETFKNPLRIAVRSGDLRWVELLLKNGAQLRGSIFNQAHNYDKLINQTFSEAKSNAVKVLLLVLKYDTNINKEMLLTNLAKNSLLESEVLMEMTKILIQAGANINCEVSGRETPLINAIIHEKYDLAVFFIEKGADIDKMGRRDYWYWGTALNHACNYLSVNCITLLIEKGANITLNDSTGKTPFKMFIYNYHSNYARRHLLSKIDHDDFVIKRSKALTCFVKEIARAKFESRQVIPSDLDIISNDPNLSEFFKKCNDQLLELKSTMFYPPYTFADVLGMRNKNMKKLANLLKNEDFALILEAISSLEKTDGLYYEDLNRIFKEAVIIRNKYNELELTLKSVLGKFIPTDVIILIIDCIKPQDLRLYA